MGKKAKAVVIENGLSFLLAAVLTIGAFLLRYGEDLATPALLVRPALLAGGLFLLLSLAFGLFTAAVRRQVAKELTRCAAPVKPLLLRLFVCYKEGVKLVFGVSLMLGWIAGMLFIVEHFRQALFLVPLLLGLGYSALLFVLVYSFANLLDHIPYPFGG